MHKRQINVRRTKTSDKLPQRGKKEKSSPKSTRYNKFRYGLHICTWETAVLDEPKGNGRIRKNRFLAVRQWTGTDAIGHVAATKPTIYTYDCLTSRVVVSHEMSRWHSDIHNLCRQDSRASFRNRWSVHCTKRKLARMNKIDRRFWLLSLKKTDWNRLRKTYAVSQYRGWSFLSRVSDNFIRTII